MGVVSANNETQQSPSQACPLDDFGVEVYSLLLPGCRNYLYFLEGVAVKRLERYGKARASMEAERRELEVLRQHVPLTPQFDQLLRYEASLERSFDRTLTQLERVQRMRLGQPVPPKIEVRHSLS